FSICSAELHKRPRPLSGNYLESKMLLKSDIENETPDEMDIVSEGEPRDFPGRHPGASFCTSRSTRYRQSRSSRRQTYRRLP
ncbi:hypothetical protein LLE87_32465, partial [Paenibacillus polymyxa]|nr:hypothetical protein [Paenibacillus polymyxa]